jgi:hypothetical protein
MQIHPSIQHDLARQRQRELIAQADSYRRRRGSTPAESREAAMTTTDLDTSIPRVRQLAHRTDGGVEVTLDWDESDDGLAVTVSDTRTGERFVLAAAQENALDVFYHPYAHAALQSGA